MRKFTRDQITILNEKFTSDKTIGEVTNDALRQLNDKEFSSSENSSDLNQKDCNKIAEEISERKCFYKPGEFTDEDRIHVWNSRMNGIQIHQDSSLTMVCFILVLRQNLNSFVIFLNFYVS